MNILAVVFGLIINQGKVLLIQESNKQFYKKWFFPGGRIEVNENIIDALIREVHEEANVKVNVGGLFYFDEAVIKINNESFKRYKFSFLCSTDDFKEKNIEDEHSVKSKWISIDEVSKYELRDPIVMDILKRYKKSREVMNISNFVII